MGPVHLGGGLDIYNGWLPILSLIPEIKMCFFLKENSASEQVHVRNQFSQPGVEEQTCADSPETRSFAKEAAFCLIFRNVEMGKGR